VGWDRLCSAAQNFRKRSRVSVPHRSVNDVEPKAFYVLHEALMVMAKMVLYEVLPIALEGRTLFSEKML
jgi:hypothetical protein